VRDTSGTVNGTVNGTATGQLNDYYSTSSKDVRDSTMKKNRDSEGTYERDNLRHISICNYAHYQGERDKSATESATANDEKPRQVNDCKSDECKDECDTGNPESATASATYIKEKVKEIYIPDFEKYQWDGMPSNQIEAIRELCRHISGELPDLLTWRKPLTVQQLIRLCEKYTLSRVSDKLEEMANKKGAEKRYSSVYLTCNNWLKRPSK